MKEYKVLHVQHDTGKVEDSKYFWEYNGHKSAFLLTTEALNDALNFYAKEGWRLISSYVTRYDHAYLYLERDIS